MAVTNENRCGTPRLLPLVHRLAVLVVRNEPVPALHVPAISVVEHRRWRVQGVPTRFARSPRLACVRLGVVVIPDHTTRQVGAVARAAGPVRDDTVAIPFFSKCGSLPGPPGTSSDFATAPHAKHDAITLTSATDRPTCLMSKPPPACVCERAQRRSQSPLWTTVMSTAGLCNQPAEAADAIPSILRAMTIDDPPLG